MRVRVSGPLADYELRHWSEREPGQDIERFPDHFAAVRLVRQLLHAGHRLQLRALIERSWTTGGGFDRWGGGLDFIDGDDLVEQLADALTRGSIIVIRHRAKIMVSHPPLVLEAPPAPHVPHEIEDLGTVMMRPAAGADSLTLTVTAEPELLGLATSHQGP